MGTEYDQRWGIGHDELGEDVRLVMGNRSAAFLPVSISRHSREVIDLAGDLQQASERVRAAVADVEVLVWEARQAGLSWDAIGWCTGVVGRTASEKWGEMAAAERPPHEFDE